MAIYRRGSTWWIDLVVNEKRIRQSANTMIKSEAQLKEAQLRHRLLTAGSQSVPANGDRVPEDITLDKAFDLVLDRVWKGSKSEKTVASHVRTIIAILGGDTKVKDVNNEGVIWKLVKALKDKDNKKTSINRKLSTLHTLLKIAAYKWKIIPHVVPFDRESEHNGRIFVISPELEQQIYQAIGPVDKQMEMILTILFDTGMRLSEVLEMAWKDVDFDHNMINIWENKTDRPRSIPMSEWVHHILYLKHELMALTPTGHGENVWTINFSRAQYLWSIIREKTQVADPEFLIHAIRHTFASRLVQNGVSLYEVQKLLGYESIKTVEKYLLKSKLIR
jgi:site-specific recombinase XerD